MGCGFLCSLAPECFQGRDKVKDNSGPFVGIRGYEEVGFPSRRGKRSVDRYHFFDG